MTARGSGWGLVACLLLGALLPARAQESGGREVLVDSHFQRGFTLLDPALGKKVPYGVATGPDASAKPAWTMAQWTSKFPLQTSDLTVLPDGSFSYANAGKRVVIGKAGTPEADLSFGVWAHAEYTKARKEGEPWVHLLAEQTFAQPLFLESLKSATLSLEGKLNLQKRYPMAGYSPSLHAAHFLFAFTIQNRNRQSPGFGKYYWFLVPISDDRARFPAGESAQDTGKKDATMMFMYSPGGNAFSKQSAQDKNWIQVKADLLPLILDGLKLAWRRGFLPESKSVADYAIGGFNFGWEVPGIFDADFQVRNLSLTVEDKAAANPSPTP